MMTASASMAQTWPQAANEAKPGARWWWLGSAVDKPNLEWNLAQYASHGIGAVEITPLYGVQGNQQNNIPFLSDKWMEMLRFTEEQGQKHGIEIDMATGTGWPFGGPWVPLEESACKAVFVEKTLAGGEAQALDVQAPEKERKYCRLSKVMAYGSGHVFDITASVSDGSLTWSAKSLLEQLRKNATNKTVKKQLKTEIKQIAQSEWKVKPAKTSGSSLAPALFAVTSCVHSFPAQLQMPIWSVKISMASC